MPQTLEEYKDYIGDRLQSVTEILPAIAMGDFSKRLDIPSDEDEFTELYAGINYMLEDIEENLRERKKAEEQLKESEQRYRDIVELAPDGIVTIDMEGIITSCNKSFVDITGYSRDEIIDKHFSKVPTLRTKDVPTWIKMFTSIVKGETPPPLDFEWVHKDGTLNWGEVRISLMKRGKKITGVQVITRDITERKKSKEALEKSQKRFRSLVENSSEITMIVDDNGDVSYITSSVEKILGYKSEEVIGTSAFNFVHPDDMPYTMESFAKVLEKQGVPVVIELRARHKDGSWRTILVTGNNLLDDPVVGGVVVNYRDITERKAAEMKIQEQNRFMNTVIESLTHPFCVINAKDYSIEMANTAMDKDKKAEKVTCFALIHNRSKPCSSKEHQCPMKIVTKTKKPFSTEHTHYDKYGDPRHIEVHAYPIFNDAGEVEQIIEYGLDITERKKAEESLRNRLQFEHIVSKISADLINSTSEGVDEIINEALKEVAQFTGAVRSSVFLYSDNLTKVTNTHEWCADPKDSQISLLQGIPADKFGYYLKLLKKLDTVVIGHPDDLPPEAYGEREWIKEYGFRPLLFVPMIHEGALYGTVGFYGKKDKERDWPQEAVGQFNILADLFVTTIERKKAEEDIRFQAMLLNQSSEYIISSDLNGNISYANEAFANALGSTPGELVGRTIDFFPEELDEFSNMEIVEKTMAEGYWKGERSMQIVDGSRLIIDLHTQVLRDDDGQPQGLFAIGRDITERKKAEEALRESEEKLKSIIDHSNEIFYIHDREHQLEYVSPQCEDIFGYTPDEMMVKWTTLVTDNPVNEEGFTLAEKAIETGEKQQPYILEIKRKDGKLRFIEVDESPMKDENGKVISITGALRDITEHKRADEALRESEEKFSKAFHSSPDVIIISHVESGHIYDVNDGFERILGYSHDEVIGKTTVELNIWEDPNNRQKILSLLNKGEVIKDMELGFRNKSGESVVGLLTIGLIEIDNQKYAISIARDITERKHAEDALRESEEKYSSVVESSKDVIVIHQDGIIKFVNSAATELMDFSIDEFLEKNILEFITPEYQELVLQRYADRISGKDVPSIYEISLLTKDKSEFPVEINTTIINYKGKPSALVFLRDITERKKAEEAIIKERDRAQSYLDIAGVMFVAIDVDGIVTLINPNGCEVLGYKEDEIIGKNWIENFIPERIKEEIIPVSKTLLAGDIEPAEYHENPVLTKSGEERMIAWHNTIIRDEEGNIIGHLSSGEDITERKKMAEELLQSEKLASIGQLAAGMAHEVNTPLTNISLITENMMKMTNDPELMKKMKSLSEQRRIASNIVSSLLSFSRKIEPKMEAVKLDEVLSESISFLEKTKPKNTKITMDIEKNLPQIKADSGQLRQAFTNIIDNAYDAMPKCGKLTIKAVKKDKENVEITFIDKGMGLSKEDMEHIFDPFFTRKEVGKGVGLGLSICHGIIEAHKGTIRVESEVGKGTTFTITLPEG